MSEGERIMLADAYREVKLSVSKATGSRRATFVLTDNQIHNATNGARKEKKALAPQKKIYTSEDKEQGRTANDRDHAGS